MADITDVDNSVTTAAMTEINVAPTDLTRDAGMSQRPGNYSTVATANFFPSGFQPTTAFTLYSLLHLTPSFYSVITPQGTTSVISNSIRMTGPSSIPTIPVTSTEVSIPTLPTYTVSPGTVLPQAFFGAPPT
ncbi:hypothetical protein TIFTF001_027798 [Ficus carica]|uniref:Uncharacterized protein n=1 Tax=Ficus carica TaxID=3494 RepID=A0AA88DNM0_FICCA|nr:hypothetical protein TIFTF001_027798 [Ficus carica]